LYKFTAPNQTSAVGFFLLKRTSSTGFDSFKKIGASSHQHAGLSLVLPILKSCSSGSDALFQIQRPLGPKPGSVPWKHYTDFKGPLRMVSGIAFTLEIPVKSRCLKIQKSKVPNESWGSPIDFRGYHAGFFNKYLAHVRLILSLVWFFKLLLVLELQGTKRHNCSWKRISVTCMHLHNQR